MMYDNLLRVFKVKSPNINDTAFYFKNDPEETEHYIGYMPQEDLPYWIGLCDLPNDAISKQRKRCSKPRCLTESQ